MWSQCNWGFGVVSQKQTVFIHYAVFLHENGRGYVKTNKQQPPTGKMYVLTLCHCLKAILPSVALLNASKCHSLMLVKNL